MSKPFEVQEVERLRELVEYAWTIIANAGEGNWERESSEWQEAAKLWRTQYHDYLATHTPTEPLEGGADAVTITISRRAAARLRDVDPWELPDSVRDACRAALEGGDSMYYDCPRCGAKDLVVSYHHYCPADQGGESYQKGRGAEVSGLSEGEGCREGGES